MPAFKVNPHTKNFGVRVKITPRSSKNEITGKMADGTLKIKLKAPPVDGRANEELIKFLSEEWGAAKSKIIITKGERSRNKIVEISN